MLLSGQAHSITIFNCERYSTRLDYSDRSSCVLFGDGAAVTHLETDATDSEGCRAGLRLIDTMIASDPSGFRNVVIPIDGHFWQNGRAVQKFAISKTLEATNTILAANNLRESDITYFIGHQANLKNAAIRGAKTGLLGRSSPF